MVQGACLEEGNTTHEPLDPGRGVSSSLPTATMPRVHTEESSSKENSYPSKPVVGIIYPFLQRSGISLIALTNLSGCPSARQG
uniref:Uncharacterized protein n=1 Tax=Felis catus TaxID=9685 RepID=A0ABI7W165_FELCA